MTATETTIDPTLERSWRFDDERRTYRDTPWPEGPWDQEDDKVQWIDPATGYDCLIVRNPMGGLCGYVGVPEDHPFYGKQYSECMNGCDRKRFDEEMLEQQAGVPIPDSMKGRTYTECYDHSPDSMVSVHGGLTFANFCSPVEKIEGICHIAESGAVEKPWWMGFDCGHFQDIMPGMLACDKAFGFEPIEDPKWKSEYRDMAYVKAEVTALAAQLSSIE